MFFRSMVVACLFLGACGPQADADLDWNANAAGIELTRAELTRAESTASITVKVGEISSSTPLTQAETDLVKSAIVYGGGAREAGCETFPSSGGIGVQCWWGSKVVGCVQTKGGGIKCYAY